MSEKHSHGACIRSWDASYYDTSVQKWFYGQLKLATNELIFVVNNAEDLNHKPRNYSLDFADISCINKAMSSMIFPALTARTKNNQVHWFASFQDRNNTFVVISHFFEASLLTNGPGSLSSNKGLSSQRTALGTALLKSVQDSDVTLREAASSLSQQTKQLATMACTMQDMQEDLVVAERITNGLNSWMGRWKMPKSDRPGELIFLNDNDIPDVVDVEVLFTKLLSSRVGTQTCGVCQVECNGITILDMKQKVIHHFKWSEVSRVRAVSPWEIMVTQYLIGQPDLSYNIVSIHMPIILSKVAKFAGTKLEYIEPSSSITCVGKFYPTSSLQFQEQKVISDAEIDELSATLNNIKATALAVKSEQESQLEDIDELTSSVVKANDRIRTMNKTMGKLL
ncbi:hypothetical protein EGW08_013242, partial [Elysia chlorotica]